MRVWTGGGANMAVELMSKLFNMGYSYSDIIGTLFKAVKVHEKMREAIKLEYLRKIEFQHED